MMSIDLIPMFACLNIYLYCRGRVAFHVRLRIHGSILAFVEPAIALALQQGRYSTALVEPAIALLWP